MIQEYVAVIQAGGLGTRMYSITHDKIPKPMIELNGKPMIQWQIEDLRGNGISDFVLIVGHKGEQIQEYFGDGDDLGVRISYIYEREPLGSAGALIYLKKILSSKAFILVFGDVMFQLDWKRMIEFHEAHSSKVTLLAHPNAHPYDSDLLNVDCNGKVKGIDAKNKVRNYWYQNVVNAGIYIMDSSVLANWTTVEKQDLEKDIILPLIDFGEVFAYMTSEYVKDAGTPERFKKVKKEQRDGLWNKRCYKNKQKCIFIDRDGTINKFRGLLSDIDDFELEGTVIEAIKKINSSGYLAIVVTNQPVVARGLCSIEEVEIIHNKLQTLLGLEGAYVDDIIFCPHHPDKGFPEENPIYKVECNCRKPKTGMIDTMIKKYNIDNVDSWIIGDSTIDIEMGKRAGLHTMLIKTGKAGADGKYLTQPECLEENLLLAVEHILSEEKKYDQLL